jgi:hypothetical protein
MKCAALLTRAVHCVKTGAVCRIGHAKNAGLSVTRLWALPTTAGILSETPGLIEKVEALRSSLLP